MNCPYIVWLRDNSFWNCVPELGPDQLRLEMGQELQQIQGIGSKSVKRILAQTAAARCSALENTFRLLTPRFRANSDLQVSDSG
jgi:hypothetical protein